MAEPPRSPDPTPTPGTQPDEGVPRWVKVVMLVAAIVVLLVVVMLLVGGGLGGHRPPGSHV
jgi:hypothetical protein